MLTGTANMFHVTRAAEEEGKGAGLGGRDLHLTARAGVEQCHTRTVTSSMATTRGSQALLEAAMSSAICHPNIVQVTNRQTPDICRRSDLHELAYSCRFLFCRWCILSRMHSSADLMTRLYISISSREFSDGSLAIADL